MDQASQYLSLEDQDMLKGDTVGDDDDEGTGNLYANIDIDW